MTAKNEARENFLDYKCFQANDESAGKNQLSSIASYNDYGLKSHYSVSKKIVET